MRYDDRTSHHMSINAATSVQYSTYQESWQQHSHVKSGRKVSAADMSKQDTLATDSLMTDWLQDSDTVLSVMTVSLLVDYTNYTHVASSKRPFSSASWSPAFSSWLLISCTFLLPPDLLSTPPASWSPGLLSCPCVPPCIPLADIQHWGRSLSESFRTQDSGKKKWQLEFLSCHNLSLNLLQFQLLSCHNLSFCVVVIWVFNFFFTIWIWVFV